MRKTLKLEDADGNEVCKIQERRLRVRDTMEIEAPDGGRLGLIQKAMISPLRDRFEVEIPDGPDLKVKGKNLRARVQDQAGRREDRRGIEDVGFGCATPTASRSRRARMTS